MKWTVILADGYKFVQGGSSRKFALTQATRKALARGTKIETFTYGVK